MRLHVPADEVLATFVRVLPRVQAPPSRDLPVLLARAELHGLAGVVREALAAAAIPLPHELDADLARRQIARELDHGAQLEMLRRIDRALDEGGIPAIALKGALLAERLYATPAARATGDIDLLVDERRLEHAKRALSNLGYVAARGPAEERFRREHHHLHLAHAGALPLELHFHAYRGFGSLLRASPLIDRRRPSPLPDMKAIGVLAPDDELVFLAVHAAAHRFIRLGWLYDMKLLVSRMTGGEIELAASRAGRLGYGRVVAFAAELLRDVLGVDASVIRPLGRLDSIRGPIVHRVVAEPMRSITRSATRFIYTTALCGTAPAVTRYVLGASYQYARRVFEARTASP